MYNLHNIDSTPTLGELISFTTADGRKVNLVEQIGTAYTTVGVFLLQDDTGQVVSAIESECHHNAANINRQVLQRWLTGAGKKPVTWATLVAVLRDVNLNALADIIEKAV